MSQEELAQRLDVSLQTVNRIIRGRQAVTAAMALRLADAFGTTPQFWLKLQADVDLWDAVMAESPANEKVA